MGGEYTPLIALRLALRWAEKASWPLAHGSRPASPFPRPPASRPGCPPSDFAPEGGWEYLPYRRVGWHLGGSLVPPRDPQAQTPFPSPPGARRMDFFDGARAPRGVRRALVCARGESQQCVDLPSTPLAESTSAIWQVLGDSQGCISMVPNAAKGARGQKKKGDLSTRGGG